MRGTYSDLQYQYRTAHAVSGALRLWSALITTMWPTSRRPWSCRPFTKWCYRKSAVGGLITLFRSTRRRKQLVVLHSFGRLLCFSLQLDHFCAYWASIECKLSFWHILQRALINWDQFCESDIMAGYPHRLSVSALLLLTAFNHFMHFFSKCLRLKCLVWREAVGSGGPAATCTSLNTFWSVMLR